jgi:HlyD family secretion protein
MRKTNTAAVVFIIAIVLFVLLVGSGLFIAVRSKMSKKVEAAPPVAVESVKAAVQPFKEAYSYTGTIASDLDATVSAQAAGTVKKVIVDIGTEVKAGQVLALIDDTIYLQQATIARSGYEMAKLNLASASSARPEQIAQAKANYTAAQLAAETAFRGYERSKNLFDEGVISKAALEGAQLQYETAKAQFTAAKENLRIAQTGARAEDRKVLQLVVEQAGAQAKLAQTSLGYTRITAPFAGKVVARMVNEGDFIATGMPAYEIVSEKGLKVEIYAPVEKINNFKPGQEALVKLADVKEPIKAVVSRVVPAADPDTRLFKVELLLPAGVTARPQQFADVTLEWVLDEGKVVLPVKALLGAATDKPYIFVIEGDKAKRVEVTVGLRNGTSVEILSPLKGGEDVIVSGQNYVSDGSPVKSGSSAGGSASSQEQQPLG